MKKILSETNFDPQKKMPLLLKGAQAVKHYFKERQNKK